MLSLHRKYRPQTVNELDQDSVREFFKKILDSGQFAQAYLFSGPKGTGKTSGARILAKILNCDINKDFKNTLNEPCNKCDSCQGISKGFSNGVVELDAASNRGIDDIRTLREQIHLVPAQTSFIVYIIDEVHMLTSEAFNALLKILEEPPVHAIFCLATTEKFKLPETIISRCVLVPYNKSTNKEVLRSLERVIKGEKIEIESEALELISIWCDGSFRDALNLLQTVYKKGEKITAALVQKRASLTNLTSIKKLIELLRAKDTKKALSLISNLISSGVDPQQINKLVISTSLDLVRESIENQNSPQTDLLKLIEIFSQAFKRYADVPIPSLPLEMAIVEYCLWQNPQQNAATGTTSQPKPEPTSFIKQPEIVIEKTVTQISPNQKTTKKTEVVISHPSPVTTNLEAVELALDFVKQKWSLVLEEVNLHNHGLMSLLKRGEIRECSRGLIVFGVSYEFHKEQLEQERYVSIVESALAKVFNGQVRMNVVVFKGKTNTKVDPQHQNISGKIQTEDQAFVSSVEEVFGI